MGSAFQLGQREGPIGLVGPISEPRGTIDTASLTIQKEVCTSVLLTGTSEGRDKALDRPDREALRDPQEWHILV